MIIPVSVLETKQELRVSTNFVYPPIPVRHSDWSAIDDLTYDASYDGEDETGHHWISGEQGWGASEQEAILDLLEAM